MSVSHRTVQLNTISESNIMRNFQYTSFTMILPVCNEERRIRRVIKYYKDIAPMLIIDNYSKDGTEAIVKEFDIPLIKKRNHGTTQTPEWVKEVFALVNTDYVLWLSASEFIPMTMMEKFDEIARQKQHGMVENVVVSYTCGENISIWGGRFKFIDRRIQRFFNREELDYDAVYIHAPFRIKDPGRCLKLENSELYNIVQLRDSDIYSLTTKHLNYSLVEARQIVLANKSYTMLHLFTLVMKEILRTIQVPIRQWHGVTIREIWARIFMHVTIFWMVWELKNNKTLKYSEDKNERIWNELVK